MVMSPACNEVMEINRERTIKTTKNGDMKSEKLISAVLSFRAAKRTNVDKAPNVYPDFLNRWTLRFGVLPVVMPLN